MIIIIQSTEIILIAIIDIIFLVNENLFKHGAYIDFL